MRISDWSSDVCSSDLVAERVVSGSLRGFVVIPQDFEQRLAARGAQPLVQIIADGSQPNTANYVANYAQGVVQNWRGGLDGEIPRAAVTIEPRYWVHADQDSRRALGHGAIDIVHTLIGTIQPALGLARDRDDRKSGG